MSKLIYLDNAATTNGAAPEEKRGDSQEHDMAYIESCREMFRLRQKLQHDISSKEEGK